MYCVYLLRRIPDPTQTYTGFTHDLRQGMKLRIQKIIPEWWVPQHEK